MVSSKDMLGTERVKVTERVTLEQFSMIASRSNAVGKSDRVFCKVNIDNQLGWDIRESHDWNSKGGKQMTGNDTERIVHPRKENAPKPLLQI
jgi:hypothetical protein